MDSDEARARAEASFKKEERTREGVKARMEYEQEVRATLEGALNRWRVKSGLFIPSIYCRPAHE